MRLILKDSKIVNLCKYPGVDSTTQVLKIRALFTRTLAEQLSCQDLCFAENGMPRRFGELKLAEKIDDCEVVLDGGTWLANSVSHFSIGRAKEATATDPSLEVRCGLHFAGTVPLSDWVDSQNKAEFEMSVKPPDTWDAQGKLAFEGTADEGAEGEEPDELDTGCVACNCRIPFQDGSDSIHDTGSVCTRTDLPLPEPTGPSLAPARNVGGTHQKGTRGRRNREADEQQAPVN